MRWIVASILIATGQLAVSGDDNGLVEVEALVHAGERAVIHFHFDEPPVTDDGDPVNFLAFDVGGSYVDFLGESHLLQTLVDGNETIASREAERGEGLRALFVGEDAPWNGVETDFTRFEDGSIEGVLIVEPVFDQPSGQSRIRFGGRLATGRVIEHEGVQIGPNAIITSCRIEAPIFGDRFGDEPYPVPGSQSYRDCTI